MIYDASHLPEKYGTQPGGRLILVDVRRQRLFLLQDENTLGEWTISTATNGIGNRENSFMTPPGAHRIAEKIGDGATIGMVFKGRVPTGQLADILLEDRACEEDLVTTRILWLEGLEPGLNRGEGIDSHDRYIYIHGTPEEGRLGQPASQGCIRMANRDIIELFDLVEPGTLVYIQE